MWEVAQSNMTSYLCCKMSVGKVTGHHAGNPKVGKVLHQRWISGNVHHIFLCQVQIRLPTLALKHTGEVNRSHQSHQNRVSVPHKRTCVYQKYFKIINLDITSFCGHFTYIETLWKLWTEAWNDPMEMFCSRQIFLWLYMVSCGALQWNAPSLQRSGAGCIVVDRRSG